MEELKNKEKIKADLRAIVWTDGSTRPTNPGRTGGGIHGYIYDYNDTIGKTDFKPSRFVVTNSGYKDSDSAVNYIKLPNSDTKVSFKNAQDVQANTPVRDRFNIKDFSFIVNPILYIEGGVNIAHGTNNMGEMAAAIETIKHIANSDKEINSLIIYTDSSYVVNACYQTDKAISNNTTYTANANKDYLIELNNAYAMARKTNLKVEVKWVKGHSSNIGNIKADMLADIARKSKESNTVMIKTYQPKDYYRTISIDNIISDNIDKLVFLPKSTNKIEINKIKYDLFSGLKTKQSKMIGRSVSPTSLVYILKNIKSSELLEIATSLKEKYLSTSRIQSDSYSTMLHLKELIHGDSYYYIDKYGVDSTIEFLREKARLVGDEEHHNTLATIIDSNHTEDKGDYRHSNYGHRTSRESVIKNTLDKIEEDIKVNILNFEKDSFNITNMLYKDGKLILNAKTEEILYKEEGKHFAKIRVGVDIPEINVLSKLSKKIDRVLIKPLTEGFMTIFITKDEYLIYHNPMNIFFVGSAKIENTTKKKKKK